MSLNSTSAGFGNTSTPAATATATPTLDRTCGETAAPFLLRVQQQQAPGLFDEWFLRISGNAILFAASAEDSSQFSVEASGHLCAVGRVGESGSPVVAIAETKDGLTGSGVYFVDGQRLGPDQLGGQGYGALGCALSGDALGCLAGEGLGHWVACGLGLDIASDGGLRVIVDGWNCTGIGLSAVYV